MKNLETLNRIEELKSIVESAKTSEVEGRGLVASSCKELYELIEKDYHNVGAESLIEDMYNDLCNGNFAEPFICENNKGKFELYRKIYIENVCPKLK